MVDLPEIPSDVTADELKKAEAGAASRETAVADACPTCGDVTKSECAKKIDDIQRETDAINDISDPIDRNKAITKAYTDLAEQDTENRWIKLASIVSAQGGCAMKDVKAMPEMLPGQNNMYNALGDANKAIFGSIYPLAAYRARYGYKDMKKCYAAEGKTIPPKMEEAFGEIEQGEFKLASDDIAWYEQTKVVQPVYDDYSGTFFAMELYNATGKSYATKSNIYRNLGGLLPSENEVNSKNIYDIPVSTTCGDPNTVPFIGSISNPKDRVKYYQTLMDVLARREGWPW